MKKSIASILICVIIMQIICNISYAQNNDKKEQDNITIAITKTDLLGGEIDGISVCRIGETNLGNLIADALVEKGKDIIKDTEFKKSPIVGIQNGGGIRKTISKGAITREIIDEVLPYENKMVIYVITPMLLYKVLENGVSRVQQDNYGNITGVDGRFLQVSGMKFIYDCSQEPMNLDSENPSDGNRILAVYLDNSETALDKTDNTTPIVLVSNDYCMDGRDGYSMLKSDKVSYVGDTLANIVVKYLISLSSQKNEAISYSTYERIGLGESTNQDNTDVSIIINGNKLDNDLHPLICNYKLMVPLRPIFEYLGFEVSWNETEKSILIKNPDKEICLFTEETSIQLNGQAKECVSIVKIVDGRTMISINILKSILDQSIIWDCKYNSLFIN